MIKTTLLVLSLLMAVILSNGDQFLCFRSGSVQSEGTIQSSEAGDSISPFRFHDHKHLFTLGRTAKFDSTMIRAYLDQAGEYSITGTLAKQIFQIPGMGEDAVMPFYPYSVQDTSGFYGITIIGEYDGWNPSIRYMTYSREGKLISELELAADGYDAEFHHSAFGEFINDSTYSRITVESEFDDKQNLLNRETKHERFRISKTGVISQL